MLALLLPVMLTGCSSKDDFEPGPAVAADNMSVYFQVMKTTNYVFTVDDTPEIVLTVKRGRTNTEAQVPVKVVSELPEGGSNFIVPATVDFAEGEDTSTLTIDCSKLPTKTECSLTVQIPEEYANPYAAGVSEMTLRAMVSGGWELWAEDVEFTFTSTFNPVKSNIYAIEGSNRFKIENFLNSGLDLQFEVQDKTYSHIIPLDNYITYNDAFQVTNDAYNCWLLYDTAADSYISWSPDGGSTIIEYVIIYGWNDTNDYTFIDFANKSGQFCLQVCINSAWSYVYVTFPFNPLFNM